MAKRRRAKIVIEGTDLSPESMPLSELASYLRHLEEAVLALADEGLDQQVIPIALANVFPGSNGLDLSLHESIVDAFARLQNSIANETVARLPQRAQKPLTRLSKELTSRGRAMTWKGAKGRKKARISAATPVVLRPEKTTTGTTTLYGTVQRTGGAKPGFQLELDDGAVVDCRADVKMTRDLARRLYERVAISGQATWNAETWRLNSFRPETVLDWQKTDLISAFNDLREATAGAYDDVDAREQVRALRGRD